MEVRPEISIRYAVPEDGPLLKQWLLDPEILRWFPMINEREVEDAVRVWISYIKFNAVWTAEWEGQPCGMTNLYIQPFKKLAHQCLFAIIVAKDFRGRGIGTALLSHLIKMAKVEFHIEILHLEVYKGNPAINLYKRMGFAEFGCQEHFIKENGKYTGKVFMQKIL